MFQYKNGAYNTGMNNDQGNLGRPVDMSNDFLKTMPKITDGSVGMSSKTVLFEDNGSANEIDRKRKDNYNSYKQVI